MDSQTLKRVGNITSRLYRMDISYFVGFNPSNVILESLNFSVMLVYKSDRLKEVSNYYLHDRINNRKLEFNDYRLFIKELYILLDILVD